MLKNSLKKILFLTTFLLLYVAVASYSFSQTATPAPNNSQAQALQDKINELQSKINDLQNEERTLSSQIAVMDNQIKLTEYQIQSTEEEITDITLDIDTATKKVSGLEKSLDSLVDVLLNRMIATYEVGTIQPLQILLTSSDASDFFSRLNYLKRAQAHDKQLIYQTQQAKVDYANQKEIFEEKKKKVESLRAQLEAYTNQLDKEKAGKAVLLAQTKGSEANYQAILAQTRAEFEAIQGIIAGKGTETQIGSVGEGQTIASIIPSGSCNSTGAHLHFIVKDAGSAQNPFNYLKSVEHTDYSGGDSWSPSGSWEWPISPPIKFNQGYGSNTSFIKSGQAFYAFHDGIDISGPSYTVKAVKAGTLYKGSYSVGCALPYMRVKHDDGKETLYLHVYSAL